MPRATEYRNASQITVNEYKCQNSEPRAAERMKLNAFGGYPVITTRTFNYLVFDAYTTIGQAISIISCYFLGKLSTCTIKLDINRRC